MLQGAGKATTTLQHTGSGDIAIFLIGPGSEVRDMRLDKVKLSIRASDMTIDSVDCYAEDVAVGTWIDKMEGGRNFGQNINTTLINSTFWSDDTVSQLVGASYMHVINCEFVGNWYTATDDNVYCRA